MLVGIERAAEEEQVPARSATTAGWQWWAGVGCLGTATGLAAGGVVAGLGSFRPSVQHTSTLR